MATQRRSEAIWIESKGYWQIKVQKEGVRKAFTSSVKGRKGKHEAEAKADYWLEHGTVDMLFFKAWEYYLRHVKASTGTGNAKNIASHGVLYLLPTLKIKKLKSITNSDWQNCINNMVQNEKSARTCKNVISTISAFVTFCKGERWEINNLNKSLSVPNSATQPEEKNILQPSDLKKLFTEDTMLFRGNPINAFYIYAWRLYVVTGLRRGELVGLRREDVSGALTVRRNINKFQETTQGKTHNARRKIALSNIATNILEQQQAMLDDLKIKSDWVFPNKYGECSDPNLIYRQWVRYCQYHGIKCTIHELRHTFISINKVKMPEVLIKSVVGHSVSMDTIGVYGHEVDGEKELAAQYVDDAFQELLK